MASLQDELRDVREKRNATGVRLSNHSPGSSLCSQASLLIILCSVSTEGRGRADGADGRRSADAFPTDTIRHGAGRRTW